MKRNVSPAKRNSSIARIVAPIIKRGGIVVLPTDTLYGICGSALQPKTIEHIYRLRERNRTKPFIVLIPSLASLKQFGVTLSAKDRSIIKKLWPGKVSIILPVAADKFRYLHRGTKTVAFRLPDSHSLVSLLRKTGPLVAPSANPEGKSPALTIKEAQEYFGSKVAVYIDGGRMRSKPSTLISLKDGTIAVLRPGVVRVR